jgi:hypothetical protein
MEVHATFSLKEALVSLHWVASKNNYSNSSYSGGKNQEDRGSKAAEANSHKTLSQKKKKKKITKIGLVEWLKVY